MKRSILLLTHIFLFSFVYSGEYLLSTVICSTFNSYSSTLNPAKIEIRHSTDFPEQVLFKYNSIYFMLKPSAIKDLRSAIEKYFEWEKIAIKNEAEIEKEIPIRIDVGALWSTWDDKSGMGFGEFFFTFFSQNKKRHQFIISSTKINDILDKNRDTKLDDLYFDKFDVEQLYKVISEETIKENLDKVKKQQDVESLFQ